MDSTGNWNISEKSATEWKAQERVRWETSLTSADFDELKCALTVSKSAAFLCLKLSDQGKFISVCTVI
jgi:hypothetical protein